MRESASQQRFPRFYPIADKDVLGRQGLDVGRLADQLRVAGVELLQYRDKSGGAQDVLRNAAVIREAMSGSDCRLIMNDRADLAVLAGFGGVHVGQGDLSPEDAKAVVLRAITQASQGREGWTTRFEGGARIAPDPGILVYGSEPWVGVSTHTEEQVRVANLSCADYVAVGPVFATGTKADAEALIGLEGVRRARALTGRPIVAIGGITRENARSVIDAGADSVAVISALLVEGETVEKVAGDFLEILR